ncbi:hypothetical protein [Streptomyces sp. NPDC020298]|uniref:hypothetical protein n=1 Tax=unclassified Streptomyces TaxID=2593676 RepID=UPI0033E2E21C
MSPDRDQPGFVRPAAVVNELIRALMVRCGGWLSAADRAEYELLVEEWTLATARERAQPDVAVAA